MLSRQTANCPHDRRPGMICLHCRHAEREAARARRRTVAARAGVLAGFLALLAGGAVAGAGALQEHGVASARAAAPPSRSATKTSVARKSADSQMVSRQLAAAPAAESASAGAAPRAVQAGTAGGPPVSGASQGATEPAATPLVTPTRLAPVIADGRTELGDSLYATRSGDTVYVYFDTQVTRTRRRDKFERVVRSTLPRVFGAAADSALGAMPEGALTSSGDLLSELPARGIRVALSGGRTLVLWPETRPGRDGPLVVSYRAVAGR
ncbi:MAG TPA: hypothetical protein VJU87_03165 [Gemmatimonadaceae bacterium]|nr:hypothetical protein [Gemmatimonadaceae bacterium]